MCENKIELMNYRFMCSNLGNDFDIIFCDPNDGTHAVIKYNDWYFGMTKQMYQKYFEGSCFKESVESCKNFIRSCTYPIRVQRCGFGNTKAEAIQNCLQELKNDNQKLPYLYIATEYGIFEYVKDPSMITDTCVVYQFKVVNDFDQIMRPIDDPFTDYVHKYYATENQ